MTKIKCSKCNEEIENNARFCPNCGKKIDKSEEKPDQKVKMIIFAFIVIVSIGIVVTALIYKNRDDVVNEVVVAESNQRDENKKQIEVIADFINIRKSRNINSEKLGKVRKGDIYTIISEENETSYKWVEIRTSNNIHGYIAGTSEYVKRLNITEDKKEEVQKPSNNNNNKNPNNTNKNNKQPKTDDNKSNNADNSKSDETIENIDAPINEPIVYSGFGDKIISNVKIPRGNYKAILTYNGKANFIVKLYENGSATYGDLLANEINSYQGVVVVKDGQNKAITDGILEVKSSGNWTVRFENVTGSILENSITGSGDVVTGWFAGDGKRKVVTMNYSGTANFIIKVFDQNGLHEIIANEIGAYNGQATFATSSKSKYYFEIASSGPWTISWE